MGSNPDDCSRRISLVIKSQSSVLIGKVKELSSNCYDILSSFGIKYVALNVLAKGKAIGLATFSSAATVG